MLLVFFIMQIGEAGDAPAVGSRAPDFHLPYATKEKIFWEGVRLSEIVGEHIIVLAFYPANWSGGCTKQLCLYRDNFNALQELDAMILGISGDYVYAHHEWAKQQEFPFLLVSDHLHEVAAIYGSYEAGREFNRRTVYVIDKNGTIAYKNMSYSTSDESDYEALVQVLADLNNQ